MKARLSRAWLGLAILAVSASTAVAQGYDVTSTGNVAGGVTTSVAAMMASLPTGNAIISTSTGGTLNAHLAPAAGKAITAAIKAPSPASGRAAGEAIAVSLQAAGMPGGVVQSYANAIATACSGASPNIVTAAVNGAVASIRSALAAGAVTSDQAKSLVAILTAVVAASR